MNKTVEKINSLRTELNKEAENLKKQFVTELELAAATFGVLKSLGLDEGLMTQKPIADVMTKFPITGQPSFESPKPIVAAVVKGELAAKILKAVSKGAKSQKEIEAAIGKEKIYMKLKSMVEGKSLVRVEDGGSVKYKTA